MYGTQALKIRCYPYNESKPMISKKKKYYTDYSNHRILTEDTGPQIDEDSEAERKSSDTELERVSDKTPQIEEDSEAEKNSSDTELERVSDDTISLKLIDMERIGINQNNNNYLKSYCDNDSNNSDIQSFNSKSSSSDQIFTKNAVCQTEEYNSGEAHNTDSDKEIKRVNSKRSSSDQIFTKDATCQIEEHNSVEPHNTNSKNLLIGFVFGIISSYLCYYIYNLIKGNKTDESLEGREGVDEINLESLNSSEKDLTSEVG